MAEKKGFSIDELVNFGWKKMQDNFLYFFTFVVATGIISAINNKLNSFMTKNSHSNFLLLAGLLSIIVVIIGIILKIGITKATLKIVDGVKAEYSDFWGHYRLLWPYLVATLLYGLLIFAGLILFIIPGIYWGIKYSFVPFLVIDKNMDTIEAFKKSAEMTEGLKWSLLGFYFVQIIIIMLGVLTLFFGLFASIPTMYMAQAKLYRKLS